MLAGRDGLPVLVSVIHSIIIEKIQKLLNDIWLHEVFVHMWVRKTKNFKKAESEDSNNNNETMDIMKETTLLSSR